MRTMIGAKTCRTLRSMRHIATRPYEDKSVPHLTLYVQQMNKTKLLKEKEVLLNRLADVEKEINHIDENILRLRPKLGLPEPKRGRPRKGDGGEEAGRQGGREARRIKRMRVAF